MSLSLRIKVVLAVAVLLAVSAYIALVDLGLNAGRVHRGVAVEGFDVGGLIHSEAEAALEERGEELASQPVVFTTEGFDCRFMPATVGWRPHAAETAQAAMDVGRDGGVIESAGERIRAWFGGVTVRWRDTAVAARVGRELARCDKQARALGKEIDRPRMRYLIKKTLVTLPRTPVDIPLEDG